jgi:hypothetical protein
MFYPEKIKNKKRFNLFCFFISLTLGIIISVYSIIKSLDSIALAVGYLFHLCLCYVLLEALRHNQEVLEVGKKFEETFEEDKLKLHDIYSFSGSYSSMIINEHQESSIEIESKLSFKKRLLNWITNPIMYLFKGKIRW